ncbi:MAG TPA: DinB family protein [Gemmatimonadales bacterium]|nr:DinB family protein [Gemmatimonadales bacterium]
MDTAAEFLAQSREYLTGHYLPKIRAAVEQLSDAELWWRPNDASNSVGNLLLHLAGNIRQWLVSGVGGASDRRVRAEEFSRRTPLPRDALLAQLSAAILEADAVLARLSPAALGERRAIQGREVSVLAAIYHVVEHLAMHAGQIFYLAKLRSGKDLGFYRMEGGIPRPSWLGHPTSGSA